MTDKEKHSQTDHNQDQVAHHDEEDISLLDILEVIISKKAQIFIIALIFSFFAAIYAFTSTPIYRATIGFLPPDSTSFESFFPDTLTKLLPVTHIYQKDDQLKFIHNKSLFYQFLTNIQSFKYHELVFNEKNHFKRYTGSEPENKYQKKKYAYSISKSIKLRSLEPKSDPDKFFDNTIYLDMEGTNPEFIADFLNDLAETVIQLTISNAKANLKQVIDAQIIRNTANLEGYELREKEEWLNKVNKLSYNLEVAKELGIKKHSFDAPLLPLSLELLQQERIQPLIQPESKHLEKKSQQRPLWFLYGERALSEELKSMRKRKSLGLYIQEISGIKFALATLKRIDLSKIPFKAATISQPSIAPAEPIRPEKMKIISIGLALGLIIGVIVAFISYSMEKIDSKKLPTTPTVN